MLVAVWCIFFFQAEDGIRDLVRSRGLGDVYKRQQYSWVNNNLCKSKGNKKSRPAFLQNGITNFQDADCLLYTSDAADERSSVDLGGRRIIKKKTHISHQGCRMCETNRYKTQNKLIAQAKHQTEE